MDEGLAGVLDAVGSRAWPGLETEQFDGWSLRAAEGFTGRANSVLPAAAGRLPLTAKLEAVERFYAARGLPASYLLSPAAAPPDLDAILAERGYRQSPAVLVQTAALPAVRADGLPGEPDRGWIETWAAGSGRTEAQVGTALRILERVTVPQAFALLERDGGPAAVGRGVLDGEWLGIFQMATLPSSRRRGAAREVLARLTAWGRAAGAEHAYLQVSGDNLVAQRVYAAAGFVTAYRYAYRFSP